MGTELLPKAVGPRPPTTVCASLGALAWLASLAACVGHIGQAGGTPAAADGAPNVPSDDAAVVAPSFGAAPIRRLTRVEYNNTVRDLLGDTTQPALQFAVDPVGSSGYSTTEAASPVEVEQYLEAAEALAAQAVATPTAMTALLARPAMSDETACIQHFVATFGARAYRRPLEADEVADLVALYDGERAIAGSTEQNGVALLLERFLQSPYFLYRPEVGVGGAAPGATTIALGPYELASRLSYLLWASMPDATLSAATADLATPDGLERQARRMLADPRARDAIAAFHDDWLQIQQLDGLQRDTTTYPLFTPALVAAMRAETDRFAQYVVLEGDGRLATLLTAPYSFLNPDLAQLYGVPAPTGTDLVRVDLPADQRGGLLTQASWLTTTASTRTATPIRRGRFVRERLACGALAPPPAALASQITAVDPNAPPRQTAAMLAANPACAGCHAQMNPIGLGFENYDAIGQFRTADADGPIDAHGQVTGLDGMTAAFDGAVGLGQTLAQSEQVRRCVATQWFRYAMGRLEVQTDTASLDAMYAAFSASDFNVRELLVAIVKSDAFRLLPAVRP